MPDDGHKVIVQTEGLSAAYDSARVLHDIDLTVRAGEMIAVLGPNGSGKSTLLRCLAGTLRPVAGRVLLEGRGVGGVPSRQRARQLAVVPQYTATTFAFSVRDMVAMGRNPHLALMQGLGAHDGQVIAEALAETDCARVADRLISELSGGELQRVIIARALAQEPQVLLLDEPTSHLDINHQLQIGGLLRRLNRERALTVLWVTHDLNLAAEFCDRLILLHEGRLVADGPPRNVITEEELAAVYGAHLPVIANPVSGRPQVVLVAPEASHHE